MSRRIITVLAIAGTCFELYTFMTFRAVMITKSIHRKIRKDRFIRGIEQDFREIAFSGQQEDRRVA